jgi:endonuclease YncB( thermonuclease family)
LSAGPFQLQPIDRDEDVYGRKLRIVERGGHSLGDTLVAEGLAHSWRGHRESWC